MKKRIKTAIAIAAVGTILAIGASAADGGIVKVNTSLNVRSSASTASAVKASLKNGQKVTLQSKSGNWWYIEYADGAFGYAYADYITQMNLTTMYVSAGGTNLNVRAGADTNYAIVGKLPDGEAVLCTGTYGTFTQVLYNGGSVGYVATQYLASDTVKTRAVTLAVASYKQYDTAWSSLTLPGSREPIRTHGCAVTSFAMAESYRTGKAITPKDVLSAQSFTSSGALYWPQPYTRGETTLSYVYNCLANGKPVIIHVQNSKGATHFAVVYGFSGGTLTAGGFYINDPGSDSRKKLSDLLAVYPTILKTVSY